LYIVSEFQPLRGNREQFIPNLKNAWRNRQNFAKYLVQKVGKCRMMCLAIMAQRNKKCDGQTDQQIEIITIANATLLRNKNYISKPACKNRPTNI